MPSSISQVKSSDERGSIKYEDGDFEMLARALYDATVHEKNLPTLDEVIERNIMILSAYEDLDPPEPRRLELLYLWNSTQEAGSAIFQDLGLYMEWKAGVPCLTRLYKPHVDILGRLTAKQAVKMRFSIANKAHQGPSIVNRIEEEFGKPFWKAEQES